MLSLLLQYMAVPARTAYALLRASQHATDTPQTKRRILFVSSLDSVEFVTQDLHLGRWLRSRGHAVTVVYFPGIYVAADIKNVSNGPWHYERGTGMRGLVEVVVRAVAAVTVVRAFRIAAWWFCRRHGISLERISWSSLSRATRNELLEAPSVQAYVGSGWFQSHVDGSFIRSFRGAPFDASNPAHRALRIRLRENGRKVVALTHLVASRADFDVAVFPMPYYIHWGTAFDYLRHHSTVTPRFIGRRPEFRVAIFDESIFTDQMPWLWSQFVKDVEPGSYRARVVSEMTDRLNDPSMPEPPMIDAGSVAFYPNVLWDGLTGHEPALFHDILDWLERSIRFCRQNDIPAVLKLHPASPEPDVTEFLSPEVRAWCTVLKHESSYALAARAALNVVFNGTLAFELPILELPVVSVSQSHYSDKQVCHEPATQDEYWSLLAKAQSPSHRGKLVTPAYTEASIKYYWFNRVYRWRELRAYDAGPIPEEVFADKRPHVVHDWLVRPRAEDKRSQWALQDPTLEI